MEHQLLKRRTFLGGDVAVGKKAYKRTEQIAFSAKQRKKYNEEHNQVKANTFQRLEEKKFVGDVFDTYTVSTVCIDPNNKFQILSGYAYFSTFLLFHV